MLLCRQNINNQLYNMKGISFLGLALILIGAVALIVCYFQGMVNNNLITSGSFVLMLVGAFVYVFASKKHLEKR